MAEGDAERTGPHDAIPKRKMTDAARERVRNGVPMVSYMMLRNYIAEIGTFEQKFELNEHGLFSGTTYVNSFERVRAGSRTKADTDMFRGILSCAVATGEHPDNEKTWPMTQRYDYSVEDIEFACKRLHAMFPEIEATCSRQGNMLICRFIFDASAIQSAKQ